MRRPQLPRLAVWAVLAGTAACSRASLETAGSRVVPDPISVEAPAVRRYVAPKAVVPPVIDGRLDDAIWQKAPWSEHFVDIEGPRRPAPGLDTRVRMAWDDSALYIAAMMEEPDLWGTLTQRDTIIFLNNDFEVFLDPDADTHHYYELEINALGTVWDLLLERPYRDGGPAVNEWDIGGLRSAVHLEGSINDPSDRDRGWSVELALPWRGLGETPPVPGAHWRINFSRVEWTLDTAGGRYTRRLDRKTNRPLPEANWVWSPQYAVNMHMPEMWGVVEFASGSSGIFHPSPDEPVRWALRRVYYAERAYHDRHGRYTDDRDRLGLSDMPEELQLQLTGDGYAAWIGALGISEDGRVRSKDEERGMRRNEMRAREPG